jgi:hypothetical protein
MNAYTACQYAWHKSAKAWSDSGIARLPAAITKLHRVVANDAGCSECMICFGGKCIEIHFFLLPFYFTFEERLSFSPIVNKRTDWATAVYLGTFSQSPASQT